MKRSPRPSPAGWLAAVSIAVLAAVGASGALAPTPQTARDDRPAAPPTVEATPAALVYGDIPMSVLTLLDVARLDDDAAYDLVLHHRPEGLVSREEAVTVAGRSSWPRTARLTALNPGRLAPLGGRSDDEVRLIGTGDVNNDGLADLAAVRTEFPGPSPDPREIFIYLGKPSAASGATVRPDITFDLGAPSADIALRAGDITGDGLAEVFIMDRERTRVMAGRSTWASHESVTPFLTFTPGVFHLFVGDLDGDGVGDLVANPDSEVLDVALLRGRASWPEVLDLDTASDWHLGAGHVEVEARVVTDLSGDGVVDLGVVDGTATRLLVFEGGRPMAARPTLDDADWSVTGIALTSRDAAFGDLSGDGTADVLANRLNVFLGRGLRTGAYAIGSGDEDALWDAGADAYLVAGDVDGDGASDILANDPTGDGQGREGGAGVIRIYRGPVVPTAAVSPTPRPTPTATSTASATPTATAPPTGTAGLGVRLYLPAARKERGG